MIAINLGGPELAIVLVIVLVLFGGSTTGMLRPVERPKAVPTRWAKDGPTASLVGGVRAESPMNTRIPVAMPTPTVRSLSA